MTRHNAVTARHERGIKRGMFRGMPRLGFQG
jgi:hypothetical protein